MKIPQEWIDEIALRLKENKGFFKCFGLHQEIIEKDYLDAIEKFLDIPFNREWEFNDKLLDKFKDFCISIITHQCMKNMHPLTCGVGGGSHDILVPRINYKGECYLVCPTCGWTQKSENIPI